MPTLINTELGRVELVSANLVVVHLDPGVKITESRVLQIREARRALRTGMPQAMYVVAPGEMEWRSSAMFMDFFGPEEDGIKALAVMVNGPIFSAAVNLYFGLNPARCPVKIVATEAAGYAWLAKRGFTLEKPSSPPAIVPIEPFQRSFMEPNTTHQRWHYLMLHDNDTELADGICRFVETPLAAGHGVLIVATDPHLQLVRERARGLDIARAEQRRQLVMLDAQDLLPRIMVNGMPDPERFSIISDTMLGMAREYPQLHVYGELVALLMEEGNHAATLELEELWNDLGRVRPFELLCGYPRAQFAGQDGPAQLASICDCHTQLLGTGHLAAIA